MVTKDTRHLFSPNLYSCHKWSGSPSFFYWGNRRNIFIGACYLLKNPHKVARYWTMFAGTGAPADPVCRDFTWLRVETQLCKALKWSIKADELPGEARREEREKGRFGTAGIRVLEDKSRLSPKLVFFISHGEFIIFQGPRAHKHTPGSWDAICVLKPLVVRFLRWNRQSCFTLIVHAVSSLLI